MFGGIYMQPLVIVTGLSGAGKSRVIHCLEDMGYFCIDNLPPALIPKFAELYSKVKGDNKKTALVVDIRGGEFFDSLSEVLVELEEENIDYNILFLEASDEVLVRRYKESRRVHPLSTDGEVLQWVKKERSILNDIKSKAHIIIDTSELTSLQLKEKINQLYKDDTIAFRFMLTVISFGFKYGIPLDSDLVFDVRFLPNPYYDESLRSLNGNDEKVQKVVLEGEVSKEFLDKFFDFISFLLPQYIKEGKQSLEISIGCTGGKHRSVTIANYLAQYLKELKYPVQLRHRDIYKDSKLGK